MTTDKFSPSASPDSASAGRAGPIRIDVSSAGQARPHARFEMDGTGHLGHSISTLDIGDTSGFGSVPEVLVMAEPERDSDSGSDEAAGNAAQKPEEQRQQENVDQPDQEATKAAPHTRGQRAATALGTTAPVWEVDRFRWPVVVDQLYQGKAEYFRHAGQKLSQASQQGLRVLTMTSARHGEGCTTLAICLARAVSQAGGRVALMDADLDHPQLGRHLSLSFVHGWQDALGSGVPWTEAAVVSLQDRLALIPARSDGPSELPEEDSPIPALLREIGGGFDLLIVDLGRLSSNASALVGRGADCAADAAIVVRDLRTTSEESALVVAARLKMMGLQAVGIAENFASGRTTGAAA